MATERKGEGMMAEGERGFIKSVREFGIGPTLGEMARKTLRDKGIAGPTMAHAIEEIHTPLNLAFTTYTTGTSAFQNPVGVTYEELPARVEAGKRALKSAGIKPGSRLLVTYPPLINVFTERAFKEAGIQSEFLPRSSRDAFAAVLSGRAPEAVIGESRFIRRALQEAGELGILGKLPGGITILAAGTPMDLELIEEVEKLSGASLYDLYGCQEFGWLSINGEPLREDIKVVGLDSRSHVFVGGLPTGDSFRPGGAGHVLGRKEPGKRGEILSYGMTRSAMEFETIICASVAADRETVERTARTILRLKGRVVWVSEDLKTNAAKNRLAIRPVAGEQAGPSFAYEGSTRMFDDLMRAQMEYQGSRKTDPAWKRRDGYGEA